MSQHLIIENKAVRLKLEGQALNIVYPDRKPASIPLRMLEQLTLVANIEVPVHLLHKLAQNGVSVALMNSRSPGVVTECLSQRHAQFKRREKQYALIHDPLFRLSASRLLVCAKLRHQSRFLHQLSQQHHLKRRHLLHNRHAIDSLIPNLRTATAEQLLGLEGTAARLYFDGYSQAFSAQWNFSNRNRRPPKDPVNSLLSLGYSLLNREASSALMQAGLDPAFGFYHKVSSGRHSLACDMTELYRTQVDQLVYKLLKEHQLSPSHFGYQLDACMLTKEGRQIFFPIYQKEMSSCRRALRLTAHNWAQRLQQSPLPEWYEQV